MVNKVAIIADIHGNGAALKTVLTDIDKDEEIKHIYCLGDLVGIGHETNKVLELLFARKDISYCMGNHDKAILKLIEGKEPVSAGGKEEREHQEWIASRIDTKFIPQLQHIPIQQFEKINGKNFLFVHYHLDEKDAFLPIDMEPTAKKLDEIYQTSHADVICFGHHHVIHHFKSANRLYLNPSSLGCNYKALAPYATLELGDSGQIDVSFREVPYDNKDFLLSYERLNVPDKDNILTVFHGDQHLRYR